MGRPKALLPLAGRPLIHYHVDALSTATAQVIIVVGANDADITESIASLDLALARVPITIVRNRNWASTWPSDSLRLALQQCGPFERCLVTPVDVSPVHPETLTALLGSPGPAVPINPRGQVGHPVLLDAAHCLAVLDQPLPNGLRGLLQNAKRIPCSDQNLAVDFDDPPSWRAFLASLPS